MNTNMPQTDCLQRFMFVDENIPVRGMVVKLDKSLNTILQQKDYPQQLGFALTEALLGTIMMANLLKLTGKLDLQFQGEETELLLCRCQHDNKISATARWSAEKSEFLSHHRPVWQKGRMVLNLYNHNNPKPYQSIISFDSNLLHPAFENFFLQSEQLPTSFWLIAQEDQATGLLLQQMPAKAEIDKDAFANLVQAVSVEALENQKGNSISALLQSLFPAHDLQLNDIQELQFGCQCSRERMIKAAASLSEQEIAEHFAANKTMDITCDFCQEHYRFTQEDLLQ